MPKADLLRLTLLQRDTLQSIQAGSVSMVNTGYASFRVRGGHGPVVGRLVSLGLARWPKGPIGEQTCEITDLGRAALASPSDFPRLIAPGDLPRLIARVDAAEAALPQFESGDYEGLRRYLAAAEKVLDVLAKEEGARVSPESGSGRTIRMAGVSSSATGGPAALLRNWRNAASRKLGRAA